MKAYDFKVILEPDETGGFVVSCPSLQGCYSQGGSVEEALENITEAIHLCLEDMEAEGEEIPDPSTLLVGSVIILRTGTVETKRKVKAQDPGERLTLLREVEFLIPLSPEALSRVANSLQALSYEAGRTIVRQGDEGESFFLVSHGRVGVWVGDSENEEQLVATLGRGQGFGEISLLIGARRSATVRTLEDSELLVLGKADFRDILLADPKVVESLSQILSLRKSEREAALAGERRTITQPTELDPARQLLLQIKSFYAL